MKYRVATLTNKIRSMRIAGALVGVAVDLLVMTLIPGSSILEGILAFLAGLSAGIAFMRRHRFTKYQYQPVPV